MTENLDSGPIYKKDFLRINKNTYINDIYCWGESKSSFNVFTLFKSY